MPEEGDGPPPLPNEASGRGLNAHTGALFTQTDTETAHDGRAPALDHGRRHGAEI